MPVHLPKRLTSPGFGFRYQIPRVPRWTGVVGCGFLERPRHAHCCLQARVLAGRRRKLRPWSGCTKCTKQFPGGTSLELCHTRPGPHHLPTTVAARQTVQPKPLFLLHLPFEQQLLGRAGNTSFRRKATVIANSLLSARRVACLSRPRNTPSPSCPSSTPKPSRNPLDPSSPALAWRASNPPATAHHDHPQPAVAAPPLPPALNPPSY